MNSKRMRLIIICSSISFIGGYIAGRVLLLNAELTVVFALACAIGGGLIGSIRSE